MEPKPTIDEQRAFYDQWNVQHRSGEYDQIAPEIRDRGGRAVEIVRSLGLTAPRILEVGCGTGWLTGKLCALGKVTAIDLSPQAIAVARQRNLPTELIAGDFFAVPFEEGSYDVLVCIETLFYVEDQPRFVAKMAALLKPRGHVVVTTINKFVYERSGDVHAAAAGQVRNWLTLKQIRELLSRQFDILSMSTMEPRGDRGILRLVNAPKVNALLGSVIPAEQIKRAKERLGLGGGVVVMARKRDS